MKLSYLVLFISLIAISASRLISSAPHLQPQRTCQTSRQCVQRFGAACSCLNPQGHQAGLCYCNMDTKKLNECRRDSDCVGKIHNWNGHRYCGCQKMSSLYPTGRCGCVNAVG